MPEDANDKKKETRMRGKVGREAGAEAHSQGSEESISEALKKKNKK